MHRINCTTKTAMLRYGRINYNTENIQHIITDTENIDTAEEARTRGGGGGRVQEQVHKDEGVTTHSQFGL